jgi:hypothetical protein
MHWYYYMLEILSGAFLANGVPHFVHGVSGAPFQSPFAKPPGVGESSAVVNVVWGFANFVVGLLLLHFFWPWGAEGWVAVGAGALAISLMLAVHFGKVRAASLKTVANRDCVGM